MLLNCLSSVGEAIVLFGIMLDIIVFRFRTYDCPNSLVSRPTMFDFGGRSCCSGPVFTIMVGGMRASVDPGRESSRLLPIFFWSRCRNSGCDVGVCILGSICWRSFKYVSRVSSSRGMSSNGSGSGGCVGGGVCALAFCS